MVRLIQRNVAAGDVESHQAGCLRHSASKKCPRRNRDPGVQEDAGVLTRLAALESWAGLLESSSPPRRPRCLARAQPPSNPSAPAAGRPAPFSPEPEYQGTRMLNLAHDRLGCWAKVGYEDEPWCVPAACAGNQTHLPDHATALSPLRIAQQSASD